MVCPSWNYYVTELIARVNFDPFRKNGLHRPFSWILTFNRKQMVEQTVQLKLKPVILQQPRNDHNINDLSPKYKGVCVQFPKIDPALLEEVQFCTLTTKSKKMLFLVHASRFSLQHERTSLYRELFTKKSFITTLGEGVFTKN